MKRLALACVLAVLLFASPVVRSQSAASSSAPASADTFAGLRARAIGPAVTSGRVMTIAVDPTNKAVFYVGAASGGVWKTVNGGASFQPVFDTQGSFSIGWITLVVSLVLRRSAFGRTLRILRLTLGFRDVVVVVRRIFASAARRRHVASGRTGSR